MADYVSSKILGYDTCLNEGDSRHAPSWASSLVSLQSAYLTTYCDPAGGKQTVTAPAAPSAQPYTVWRENVRVARLLSLPARPEGSNAARLDESRLCAGLSIQLGARCGASQYMEYKQLVS